MADDSVVECKVVVQVVVEISACVWGESQFVEGLCVVSSSEMWIVYVVLGRRPVDTKSSESSRRAVNTVCQRIDDLQDSCEFGGG